ncbi:MAG: UDP-N-acetylmuramate--L-alanine ligase [Clostridia bacterium]
MNTRIFKEEITAVHFIGINGISMSGLAEILMGQGYKVSGSDFESSNRTEKLQALGADIYMGHDRDRMGSPDLVVYTAAIHPDNCEYQKAAESGIPLMDRAVLLGMIMKGYPFSVGVSGAHGKTTTTAMAGHLLQQCGFDPTIHLGGEADFINGTVKVGSTEYFVTEACEYNDTFLKLSPFVGIILNIDYDHVDWFKDLEAMEQAFLKFARLIPQEGCLVACYDDVNTRNIYERAECNRLYYGLENRFLDYSAIDILYDGEGYGAFDLYMKGSLIRRVRLGLRGRVNVLNALAAAAACHFLGGDPARIADAMETMHGAKRRFDIRGKANDILIVSDYAHHPTEIDITLETASNMDHREIWAVFEPHTFTRIKVLFEEFSTCFSHANHVIMADVYNDREEIPKDMNSEILANNIAKHHPDAIYLPSYEAITDHLVRHARPGDIIMILGSKNIVEISDILYERLTRE